MVRYRRLASVMAVVSLPVWLVVAPARAVAVVSCDGHDVTVVGTDGADVLVGTAGVDVIAGLGGDDVIRGHGGDDVICGGDGSDKLHGGAGDDRLFGEDNEIAVIGDTIIGGAGDDLLDGGGPFYNDHIKFHNEPAGIHVDLQAGTVVTSRGTDTITRGGERDRTPAVFGSPYADVIDGSDAPDLVFGRGGDDVINGRDGRTNDLYGGRGDDVLTGGPTLDNLYGGPGDDVLDSVGDGWGAILEGGRGADHLIGTVGWDYYMHGGPGDDWIEGFGDGDRLYGEDGDDVLDGGTGGDAGRGGDGVDTCISIERPHSCKHETASPAGGHLADPGPTLP